MTLKELRIWIANCSGANCKNRTPVTELPVFPFWKQLFEQHKQREANFLQMLKSKGIKSREEYERIMQGY